MGYMDWDRRLGWLDAGNPYEAELLQCALGSPNDSLVQVLEKDKKLVYSEEAVEKRREGSCLTWS